MQIAIFSAPARPTPRGKTPLDPARVADLADLARYTYKLSKNGWSASDKSCWA
jgi:hypothetical protein